MGLVVRIVAVLSLLTGTLFEEPATGLVLGATYMLWLYRRVVFGRAEKGEVIRMPVLNNREITILVPLTIFIVWFGVYPAPLLDVLNPVVALISEAVSNTQMATANLQ